MDPSKIRKTIRWSLKDIDEFKKKHNISARERRANLVRNLKSHREMFKDIPTNTNTKYPIADDRGTENKTRTEWTELPPKRHREQTRGDQDERGDFRNGHHFGRLIKCRAIQRRDRDHRHLEGAELSFSETVESSSRRSEHR